MKPVLKLTAIVVFAAATFFKGQAQEVAMNSGTVVKSENPAAPAVNAIEVKVLVKNSAEKPVAVFAGAKEDIRDPKITMLGGLSKNTLYLKSNDVICILTDDNKPRACAVIKPGVTTVEVNPSAQTLNSK